MPMRWTSGLAGKRRGTATRRLQLACTRSLDYPELCQTYGRSTRYFAHMAEKFSYAEGAPHGLSQYFTWTGKSWKYAGYKINR